MSDKEKLENAKEAVDIWETNSATRMCLALLIATVVELQERVAKLEGKKKCK